MMMNNNFNNPMFGGYPYGGYVATQPVKPAAMTNPITEEEYNSIKKHDTGLNLVVTKEEDIQARCPHRSAKTNQFTVIQDEEGNFICTKCNGHVIPFEGGYIDAKEVTDKFVSLLETTKMAATTMSPQAINTLFQIIPYVKRIPEIYKKVRSENNNMLNMNNPYAYQQDSSAWAMYGSLVGPMGGAPYYDPNAIVYGAQPAPMQYAPQGQMAQYGQQPMMQGYPQPMQGYPQQGMAPQYMQQPQMAQQEPNPFLAQQPAPQQPQAETVTVTKKLVD